MRTAKDGVGELTGVGESFSALAYVPIINRSPKKSPDPLRAAPHNHVAPARGAQTLRRVKGVGSLYFAGRANPSDQDVWRRNKTRRPRLCPPCCALLLVALCCVPLAAFGQAEAPKATKPPEVDAAPYAPRKLKFRDVEEKLTLELKRLDPKLLEQQYVATVRLVGSHPHTGTMSSANYMATLDGIKEMIEATPEKVRPPKELLDQLLEYKALSEPTVGRRNPPIEFMHLRHLWKTDVALMERLQQTAWRSRGGGPGFGGGSGFSGGSSFFPGSRAERGSAVRIIRTPDRPGGGGGTERHTEGASFVRSTHELQFLAPTAAQAKSLAEAYLTIYDHGHALPARKTAAQWKQNAENRLSEHQALGPKVREEFEKATKAWETAKNIETLSPEETPELKKKQILLKVEQVGVTTRIAALEKKIAEFEKRRPGSAPENIVGLKEAAEIDLAGLTGQLGEIGRLLRGTSDRESANNRLRGARHQVQSLETELELVKLELEMYEEDYRATAPYELLDEAIPVQPIAWMPTAKPE
jgi:hypothetical protein